MTSKIKKIYTGFAGMPVCQEPHKELIYWFNKTLKKLDQLPKESKYRSITEKLINDRKIVVESTSDPAEIEVRIGSQCEEMLEDVKNEYNLAEHMIQYKPWDPLEQKPSSDQWKWPI